MIRTLAGRRIVVTRFEPHDGPLATALRLAGAEPIVVPLIGIDPLAKDASDTDQSVRDFDWIAFTSANGVRIFWARLSDEEQSAFRVHRGIAAVGPATARVVSQPVQIVRPPREATESTCPARRRVRPQVTRRQTRERQVPTSHQDWRRRH